MNHSLLVIQDGDYGLPFKREIRHEDEEGIRESAIVAAERDSIWLRVVDIDGNGSTICLSVKGAADLATQLYFATRICEGVE
jgi:hypothetical protein